MSTQYFLYHDKNNNYLVVEQNTSLDGSQMVETITSTNITLEAAQTSFLSTVKSVYRNTLMHFDGLNTVTKYENGNPIKQTASEFIDSNIM